jgi:phage shock protein PspC (stress-responsive transcriptional regulator)
MMAGVAAGIADRLGIDRWIVRLAFLLLIFGGGAGLLLYIAGFLLIPGEGESESIGQRWANQANSTSPWVGILLVLIAAGILFSNFPFFNGGLLFPTALLVIGILLYRGDLPGFKGKPRPRPDLPMPTGEETDEVMTTTIQPSAPVRPVVVKPRTPPSPLGRITIGVTVIALGLLAVIDRVSPGIDADTRHYLALAVTTLGLGVLVGTVYGRARWIIPIGLLLLPPLVTASAVEAGAGSWHIPRLIRPTHFAQLAPLYERAVGEMVIDLTELPWNGETVEFDAEVGIGKLELILPDGVGIEASSDIAVGNLNGIDFNQGGLGVEEVVSFGGDGLGQVIATLEVAIGEIEIDLNTRDLFDGDLLAPEADDDLVLAVVLTEDLQDTYTTGRGDINLDLSALQLIDNRTALVASGSGDIVVTLPTRGSYRVIAHSENGEVELVGEVSRGPGSFVQSESIVSGLPLLELVVESVSGDIIINQGDRS